MSCKRRLKNRISMREALQRLTLIISRVSLWHDKSTVFLVSRRNNHLPGLWATRVSLGQTSNKVLQPVPRDDEIPPACLRALLQPSKSCKKPSRDRGAISICACSKLLQHTAKQRELPGKKVFQCCSKNKLR